jgi:methionine synthase I (cobalamin-dependent)
MHEADFVGGRGRAGRVGGRPAGRCRSVPLPRGPSGAADLVHSAGRRGRAAVLLRRKGPAATAALAGAALTALMIPRAIRWPQPPARGPVLRVLTANLLAGQASEEAVAGLVQCKDVDVLFLQELTGAAVTRLGQAGLSHLLPYEMTDVRDGGPRGSGIYARFPLGGGLPLAPTAMAQPTARLELPSGQQVELICVHPCAPTPLSSRRSVARWREELAAGAAGPAHRGARRSLGHDAPGRRPGPRPTTAGSGCADHPQDVTGDPDLLNLTRPDVVLDMHRQYLAAGADITTTNTFTATSIGQADYGLQPLVREMNLRGAQLARQAADEAGGRFVAGSVGPLNVTLSLSPRVEDPAYRAVSFDQVYARVRRADAGAGRGRGRPAADRDDLRHAEREGRDRGRREVAPDLPLWISATIVDLSGRTLSGQTVEAFWRSVEHASPLVVGVNCSLGAEEMRPYVAELSRLAGTYTAAIRTPACRTRSAATTRRRRRPRGCSASSPRPGWSTSSAAAAGRRRRTSRGSRPPSGPAAAPVPATRAARTRFSGLEPFEIGRRHRVRDDRGTDQRHRLGGSGG